MAATPVPAIADLRHRRRELRRELARVRWWRQLLDARRDLTVARLAHAADADPDLDITWEALAAGAPTSAELAGAIWPEADGPKAGALDSLDVMDQRLEVYESRLSDNLDSVTAQMVNAMGDAKRTGTGYAT